MAARQVNLSPMDWNSFTKPWNDSDVILVVQSWELHVHKSILSLQSPVFKAMFSGQFKEATAERVVLEGKTHKWFLQFLRLLYPPNMIKDSKIVISDANVLEILKLADEYQACNVVSQCLAEVTLTKENVMKLLPYAVRYDQSAVPRLKEKIESSVPVKQLGEFAQDLPDGKVALELLVSKGCHLERVLRRSWSIIRSLLTFIVKKSSATSVRCKHTVNLSRYEDAVKCSDCVSVYRTTFVDEVANQIYSKVEDSKVKKKCVKTFRDFIFEVLYICVDVKEGY